MNNGQFKKGQSGNVAGKPKGAVARTTKEVKETLQAIIQHEIDNIEASLEQIRQDDPAKYLDVVAKLLPYVVPRQLDVNNNDTNKIIVVRTHESDKYSNIKNLKSE